MNFQSFFWKHTTAADRQRTYRPALECLEDRWLLAGGFAQINLASDVPDLARKICAKGATDEYRTGRPLRELQHLLGHKSVKTTEIYLKDWLLASLRCFVFPPGVPSLCG